MSKVQKRNKKVAVPGGAVPGDAASRHVKTRQAHAQERAQDYVELIDELVRRQGSARVVDIARSLGVSHVTVVRTIARMQQRGLVLTEPYRAIELTPAGRRLAADTRRRHEIVVSFLIRIGVPREVAELDAEGIEHHVSPETLAAFESAGGRSIRRSAINPPGSPGTLG